MSRILVSWSSGKDSTLALYATLKQGYTIAGLLTTVNSRENSVTGHRVPISIIRSIAGSLGFPLYEIYLPEDLPPKGVYESIMLKHLVSLKKELGIDGVAFGDIFVRDMIEYKETLLGKIGLKAIYPLLGLDSMTILNMFLTLGFKAIIVAIDYKKIPYGVLCSELDMKFISLIPAVWDKCGEYGEYHTLVYDGPVFRNHIKLSIEGYERIENRVYCKVKSM